MKRSIIIALIVLVLSGFFFTKKLVLTCPRCGAKWYGKGIPQLVWQHYCPEDGQPLSLSEQK